MDSGREIPCGDQRSAPAKSSSFITRCSLFIILFFVFCQNIVAQTNDTIIRPRVGLVLSGGGAKGFAHIGVLKVIE